MAARNSFPKSHKDFATAIRGAGEQAGAAAQADALARVPRAVRRNGARMKRFEGRAYDAGQRLVRHVRDGRSIASAMGPGDAFMMALGLYLLSFGAAGASLEFGGSRASLQVWSDTLGGDIPTTAIAASLGLVLVLLGHLIGHFAHTAIEERNPMGRIAWLAAAVALTVPAVIAIDEIGYDRPKNLAAQSAMARGALLEDTADEKERAARPADKRAASGTGVIDESSEGKELREEAAELREQARAEVLGGLNDRKLGFFTAVQWAALALSIGGGFVWAATAMERLHKRFHKLMARAQGKRGEVRAKLIALYLLNVRGALLAEMPVLAETDPTDAGIKWADRVLNGTYGEAPPWADILATLDDDSAGDDGDELDRARRRRAEATG